MTSTWILTLAFVGPTAEPASAEDANAAAFRAMTAKTQQPARSKAELKTEYQRISRKFARQARPDPRDVTRDMVSLYFDLNVAKGITHRDKRRMKLGLKLRMEQTLGRLYLELKKSGAKPGSARVQATANRSTTTSPGETGADADKTGANPGATNFQVVQELITLIQDTIAPDSWNVRGGRGSIGYFSPIHALVIRANGEVHHQIGGTLEQVRRIR